MSQRAFYREVKLKMSPLVTFGSIFCASYLMSTVTLMAQLVEPIEMGSKLGQLPIAGVLGAVATVSVIGMVLVYKDMQKVYAELQKVSDTDKQKLFQLIEVSIGAEKEVVETMRHEAAVLVEVKDAIKGCLKNHA